MSFLVTAPCGDRALLSNEEAATALPGDVSAEDRALLVLAASDMIARECLVRRDGIHFPTLRSEGVSQTFRLKSPTSALYLGRRFVSEIGSVTVDGSLLDAAAYECEQSQSVLRLVDGKWCGLVVVAFTAGFVEIPADLKLAVKRAIQEQASATGRDPLLRSETVEGIGRNDYWVSPGGTAGGDDSVLSPGVRAMLSPYRSLVA